MSFKTAAVKDADPRSHAGVTQPSTKTGERGESSSQANCW